MSATNKKQDLTKDSIQGFTEIGGEELEEMRRMFEGLADEDGELSRTSFAKAMGDIGVAGGKGISNALFDAFDSDSSGTLSLQEFLSGIALLTKGDMRDKLKFSFHLFDRDNSGSISRDEMAMIIRSMYSILASLNLGEQEGAQVVGSFLTAFVDPIVDYLFDQIADIDKDEITFEQYIDSAEEIVGAIINGVSIATSPNASDMSAEDLKTAMGESKTQIRTYVAPRTLTKQKSYVNKDTTRLRSHGQRAKGRGKTVFIGHRNWNLTLAMMLGIRVTVGRLVSAAENRKRNSFIGVHPQASLVGSAMREDEYKVRLQTQGKPEFKDYHPHDYVALREIFGCKSREYMLSLGPEQLLGNLLMGNLSSMSELISEGKSGSFFYFSYDGNYMMKTIKKKESLSLRRMTPSLVEHFRRHPFTLINNFYGHYRLTVGGRKYHFVVMGNIMKTEKPLARKYDLKGSTIGRTTPERKRVDPGVALKDLDFQEKISIGKEARRQIMDQVDADAKFLEKFGTMDFSLLVGVDDHDTPVPEESRGIVHKGPLGGIIVSSKDGMKTYYMGIIDILVPYDFTKMGEHMLKGFRYNRRRISCVPPSYYAQRFTDYIDSIVE